MEMAKIHCKQQNCLAFLISGGGDLSSEVSSGKPVVRGMKVPHSSTYVLKDLD